MREGEIALVERYERVIDEYDYGDLNKSVDNIIKIEEWCKEQFVRLDTIKFEKERQAELKAMYDFVQAVDRELEMLIQSKKQ